MKKTIALLLAALMLLSSAAVFAAEFTNLDEKLTLQLQNGSGFNAQAAITALPNLKMSALDAQGNLFLTALLSGSVLELKTIKGAGLGNRDKEDLTLTLSRGGNKIADIRHTSDSVLESFASSLLGSNNYVSTRGDGRLLNLLFDWNNTWPGVERAIFAMSNADLEWRKQAEAQLKTYSDKLSIWLQGYTRFSNERDQKGQTVTINEITIPMTALKTQMKMLLTDLYANKNLLTLLGETMTPAEAAAYLQPMLLKGFQDAVDALPLLGNATVLRRYDPAGKLLLDEVNLPMGGSRGIESIHYRLQAGEPGQDETLLEVKMLPVEKDNAQGSFYSLKLLGGDVIDAADGNDIKNYTGTLTIRSEAVKDKGFQVLLEEKSDTRSYDFNLYMDNGKLMQDPQTRQYSSEHEISLVIKPIDIEGLGDQSMNLKLVLTSGASTNSATKFTGQLVWKDLMTDAAITADLSGGSIPPWVVPSVDAMPSVRMDRMSVLELQNLKTQLQTSLLAGIARLTSAMKLPTVP